MTMGKTRSRWWKSSMLLTVPRRFNSIRMKMGIMIVFKNRAIKSNLLYESGRNEMYDADRYSVKKA